MVAVSQMRITSASRWVMSTMEHPFGLQPVEQFEQLLGLIRGQGGGDLVQQQDLGLQCQGAGEIHQAQNVQGQIPDHAVPVQRTQVECLQPLPKDRRIGAAQPQVLGDREIPDQGRVLEDRGDAALHCFDRGPEVRGLPLHFQHAPVRRMDSGQDADQGALAGAVGAQQGVDLVAAHGHVDRL